MQRERERDRQTDRQTDRHRQRELTREKREKQTPRRQRQLAKNAWQAGARQTVCRQVDKQKSTANRQVDS